jgi:hypothetical protein
MSKNIAILVNRVTDLEKLYNLILEQKKENMNDKNNTQPLGPAPPKPGQVSPSP